MGLAGPRLGKGSSGVSESTLINCFVSLCILLPIVSIFGAVKAFLQEWAKKTRPTEAPHVCNDCPSLPGPLEWSAWVLLCCSDVVFVVCFF